MSTRTKHMYTVVTYSALQGAKAAALRYDAKLPDAVEGASWTSKYVEKVGKHYVIRDRQEGDI